MKKSIKHLTIALVCLILSFIVIPLNTFAMSGLDPERQVDFRIEYQQEGTKLANVLFEIYKVASLDKTGKLNMTDDFAAYPVDLSAMDENGWKTYALTLKGYVQRDRIPPTVTGKTDAQGVFETKLYPGLYFIIGQQVIIGDYRYESSPYLVLLPGYDQETGTWNYEVTSLPKSTKDKITQETINKKVIKVWKDDGYENKRPESVEIELLANGQPRATVLLNKENNWRHTWTNLDPNVSWSVVEKNLDRNQYRVMISEDGSTFIVENTYIPPKNPEEPETSETPGTPEKPVKPQDPPKKPEEPEEILPQTGQPWWPVYILVGTGSLLILLGFIQSKRKEGRNE